jgi:hypothetical protein
MNLTEQELYILSILRETRPFEIIQITKDQLGRPDHYIVTRTQKLIVSKTSLEEIRAN